MTPFRRLGAAVDICTRWDFQAGGPQGAQHDGAVGCPFLGREYPDLPDNTLGQGDLEGNVAGTAFHFAAMGG